MSSLIVAPEKRFVLAFRVPDVRNAATHWTAGGGSTASGYTFPQPVVLTGMWVACIVTTPESGSTFTVTAYKDDITASDDVFSVAVSLTSAVSFGVLDSTTGSKDGTFGTGSELNIKCSSNGASNLVTSITVILHGYWVP